MEKHVKRNFFYATTNKNIKDFEVLEGDYAIFKTLEEIRNLDGFMWYKDAFLVIEKMIGAYKGK